MQLDELQSEVERWIRDCTAGYFPPLMMLARLTEELGELARAVSHEHGEKRPKPGEQPGSVPDEIGDLLFVLVCLANAEEIRLEDVWTATKKKLYERDGTRWKV